MDVMEKLVELIENAESQRLSAALCCTTDELIDLPSKEEYIAEYLVANGVTVIPPEGIGEMSDGYHTFNELYHHRAVLFSVICNAMPDKAWKSKRHDTGDMYDGMFIVGIETNHGQATYHYDVDPYWDMFNVPELEYAPKWDGHTPQEAINRIADGVTVQEWISVKDRLPEDICPVLVALEGLNIAFHGFYQDEKWWKVGAGTRPFTQKVTHWMPLPQPPKGETIYCKDCEHLMFSDCYGECAKWHKGIVNPNDTCEHAKRKPPKGE